MALIDLSKYDIGISKNVGAANVGDSSEAAVYGELARFGQTVAGISNELLAKKIDIETSVDANKAEQQFQTEMTRVKLDADSRSENGKIDGIPYSQYMAQKTDELSMRYQDGLGRDLAKRKFQFNNMDYIKNEKVSAVITETKKIQDGVKKSFEDTLKIEATKNTFAPVGGVVSKMMESVNSMNNIVDAGHKTHYAIGNEMETTRANTMFDQSSNAAYINALTEDGKSAVFDLFEMTGFAATYVTSEGFDRKKIGQYMIENKTNFAFFKDMDNDAIERTTNNFLDDYVQVKGMSEKDIVMSSKMINAEYVDKVLSKVDPRKVTELWNKVLSIKRSMGEGVKPFSKHEALKVANGYKETSSRIPQVNAQLNAELFKVVEGLDPSDKHDVFLTAAKNHGTIDMEMELGLNGNAGLQKALSNTRKILEGFNAQEAKRDPEYQKYVSQVYTKLQSGDLERSIVDAQAKYTAEFDKNFLGALNKYDKTSHALNIRAQEALLSGSPKAKELLAQYANRVNSFSRVRPSTGTGTVPINIFKSMPSLADKVAKVRLTKGDAEYGKVISNIINNVPENLRADAVKTMFSEDEAKAVNFSLNIGKPSSTYDVGKFTSDMKFAKDFDNKAQEDFSSKIMKETITRTVANLIEDVYGGMFLGQGEIAALNKDSLRTTIERSLKAEAMKNPGITKSALERLGKETIDSKVFYHHNKYGSVLMPSQEGTNLDKGVLTRGMSDTVSLYKEWFLSGKYEIDIDKMPKFKAYQSRMVNNGKIFDTPALIRQGEIVIAPAGNSASGSSTLHQLYLLKDGIGEPIFIKEKGASKPLVEETSTIYNRANGRKGWFD